MKLPAPLSLLLVLAALPFQTSSCVFVKVEGGFDEELWDEDGDDESGFHDLAAAVEGSLVDPKYALNLSASPWHSEAEWAVSYAPAGSDVAAAFQRAREAVIERVHREGGHVRSESDDGPLAWSCKFHIDGERGSASVRLVEDAEHGSERPDRLEVTWEQTN